MKRPSPTDSIRLINLDETPRRGERIVGEWPGDDGPKLLVAHWRREKRATNKQQAQQRLERRGRIAAR